MTTGNALAVQRGDVVWFEPDPAEGSEQSGRRPAIVVSRNSINRRSPVVIVVPLTTYRSQRLYPSDVLVRAPEAGLSQDSVALALHVRGVDRRRLGTRLGSLEPGTVSELERALLQVMDIDR